jgi:hypothetical protein
MSWAYEIPYTILPNTTRIAGKTVFLVVAFPFTFEAVHRVAVTSSQFNFAARFLEPVSDRRTGNGRSSAG